MTDPKIRAACGRAIPRQVDLLARVRELEAENAALRRIIKARLAPAEAPRAPAGTRH